VEGREAFYFVKEKLFYPSFNNKLSNNKNIFDGQSFCSGQKYSKAGKNLYFCGLRIMNNKIKTLPSTKQ
jgi:hypothetical protein